MNKKAYVQIIGPIIGVIVLIMLVSALMPLIGDTFNKATCKNEKETIANLNSRLADCQNQLNAQNQKLQDALTGLGDCQNKLSQCESDLLNCNNDYSELKEECDKKDQPFLDIYYFIKVFSDKIILFDLIILYNIQLFALFLGLGITFTVKLFEIDVEIKVLNKKYQNELVKTIREFLITHPWGPTFIVLVIILITNLIQLI